ncbi:hypothetical protein LEP1GSC158_4703 [Leptospira interrogans serovar Zanoni str. LT2156]|uniref:Uncharacterized protein n=1 Tax=Leptospira interrogans serovar Zanoni str. LT2156 TaxID=1001601 RepID=M6H8V1_LEPIR|nr:hypothetical protein LEP1GSC158_4703 [Leptospira interrogans serovar Zanoni str. LT2156]
MEFRTGFPDSDFSFDSGLFCFFITFWILFFKKIQKRKNELNPKNFEAGLNNIQKSFYTLMAKSYEELRSTDGKSSLDLNVLKEQITELERTIQGLKNFLDSEKNNLELFR